MGKGLQFNASYTFSKSIDYNSQSSQGVTVQDSYNLRGDRGLSRLRCASSICDQRALTNCRSKAINSKKDGSSRSSSSRRVEIR
jgi:hypothetical protein